MSTTNHQFRLAARPVGNVKRSDFNIVEENLRDPADGEVVIKTQYISLWKRGFNRSITEQRSALEVK